MVPSLDCFEKRSLASVVIAGTLEGANIDFILSSSLIFFSFLVYLSLSVCFTFSVPLSHPVLAIMTAIHIEFLYALKVMRKRAGCK